MAENDHAASWWRTLDPEPSGPGRWCRALPAWRQLWHPEVFHSAAARAPYFEGWYFKLVSRDGSRRAAVIPGISLSGQEAHAFVQVLDGTTHRSDYYRFPLTDFRYASDRFAVRMGDNYFGSDGLRLALGAGGREVRGEVRLGPLTPWPVTACSPGVMGWYAFVPRMECYHGVLSFRHALAGALEWRGASADYSGGIGYLEKDWGASFPSAWIWLQSNHFAEAEASFFLSVARIPWLGGWFPGLIAGLWLEGRLHRFATYTGARLSQLSAATGQIRVELQAQGWRLRAEAEETVHGPLAAPVLGAMQGRIQESLQARIRVTLYKPGGGVYFSGLGLHGGMEAIGDLAGLLPPGSGR
jgi:tocopherol cyclase